MKLLIIGHSVEDHIHKDETILLQPGGIYYTASALSAIKDKNDELFLCSAIEAGNYNLFASVYNKLNRIYLQEVESIPRVHLIINIDSEREEYYSNISDHLNLNLDDINSYDGILINMITGYDISLQFLQKLRSEYNGTIYIDVHTLARGVTPIEKGIKREFRKIPDFNKWAESVDIIQVNISELKMITDSKSEIEAADLLLTKEGQILLVTKDRHGATGYLRRYGNIKSFNEAAIKIKEANKVGCGDIFGAVFFYTYIKKRSIAESLSKANTAAGRAAGFNSLSDITTFKLEA